jgi:hypothetical protein
MWVRSRFGTEIQASGMTVMVHAKACLKAQFGAT